MVESPLKPPGRLASIDAYRGFVMFLMMAQVLNFTSVSKALPESAWWDFLSFHQLHVEWTGCSLLDLIQPSFSFLVGVALPFSLAKRLTRGQSLPHAVGHAAWRALLLVLLGIFLRSVGEPETNFTFVDTLTQIGMGYLPLFLIGLCPRPVHWLSLVLILVGYWAAFAAYPLPSDFNYAAVGVPHDWPYHFTGFAAHWNKNSNLAWAFDVWFLNLFPRGEPFVFNDGGYATLSFIPTLGTMLLGLIAGGWLRSEASPWTKAGQFVVAGLIGLTMGLALHYSGICPSVKRIWTPAWTVYSGGWCFLLLAAFYVVMDIGGRQAWAFPFKVIGMNSIAAYCIAHLFEDFIAAALGRHLGSSIFAIFGDVYQPVLLGLAVLLIDWLILFWMYRRKFFLKI
jgi:predicted acyltransferase